MEFSLLHKCIDWRTASLRFRFLHCSTGYNKATGIRLPSPVFQNYLPQLGARGSRWTAYYSLGALTKRPILR